jgi:integrase
MTKKRRGNGEGKIYKRKDGRYEARYTVHPASGPKRRAIYGKTRAEVAEKLTRAMADRDKGVSFDASIITLGEYLRVWLEDSVKDRVKLSTYEGYARMVRNHISPMLGGVKLKNLTPPHLRRLYKEKLDSGLGTRSVQYIHTTLHKALKQAVDDGLILRNVADSVKPPQLKRTEMKPLSPKQAKALLEAAGGDRFEAMYVLAITAGLRQGELLGLKWEDVDLEDGKLRVRRTLYKGNFTTPKTAKSRRTVKLTVRAVEALQRHREAQLEESVPLEGLWQDHGLIFTTQIGTPTNRHNFNCRNFKPLLKMAGLPHTVRFHDLRHTCATLLLSKNVNPKVVSEMLGHANVSVTLDTYSHVLPHMQDGAVDAMDSSLS